MLLSLLYELLELCSTNGGICCYHCYINCLDYAGAKGKPGLPGANGTDGEQGNPLTHYL